MQSIAARTGLTVILALACAGCRRDVPNLDVRPNGFVAVVGVGQDHPLWPILNGTARRFHRELGLSVPLRVVAPTNCSVNAQKNLIRQLHDDGMTALCVQVSDPDALTRSLDSVAAQGVQVVTMMRPVTSKASFVHCGPDQERIGAALADALVAALRDGGTVALIHADSAGDAFARRRRAFLARVSAATGVHVILQYDCHADPKTARNIIRDTMQRFPRLGGWAVLGNWPLCDRDNDRPLLPPTCHMVAVDPFPNTWACFDDGTVDAMIATDYCQIIERALTTAYAARMGGSNRVVSYAAPARTVTADHLETFKREWRNWVAQDAASDHPTPPGPP